MPKVLIVLLNTQGLETVLRLAGLLKLDFLHILNRYLYLSTIRMTKYALLPHHPTDKI